MMRSKNERYEMPDESESWANKQFTIILDYLCEQNVKFNGQILLKWIAAPHVSIWTANSLEQLNAKIWIMHNEFMSDCFVHREMTHPQQAIKQFGLNWKKVASAISRNQDIDPQHYSIPDHTQERALFADKLLRHANMLLGIAGDNEIWQPEIQSGDNNG